MKFSSTIRLWGTLGGILLLGLLTYLGWESFGLSAKIGAMVLLLGGIIYVARTTLHNVFLTARFFWAMGGIIALFAVSFVWEVLFSVAQLGLIALMALLIVDIALLYANKTVLKCERKVAKRMSVGDDNKVELTVESLSGLPLSCELIDEIPVQFQKRDFVIPFSIQPDEEKRLSYFLHPVKRGEYAFGNLHLFIKNSLGIAQRRMVFKTAQTVSVYPSIIQMKQLELKTLQQLSNYQGIKKMRRIGHSYEFEQIKNYVRGDDYRSINWKATSRKGHLMVNQYEDERAQQVYNIIDKSRAMKMPFNELSLLDYAINASLVISNVSLKKHDRAGLITFSDKMGTMIKAERKSNQLSHILQALYREQERELEANYELLYSSARRLIQGRSLIFLYTNFESRYAMERVLPILRRLNNLHLLVVVFFENTEITAYTEKAVDTTEDIYYQTVARQFLSEKQQIVHSLRQYGIQSILTTPEDLSINTVNKYLELKSRGLI